MTLLYYEYVDGGIGFIGLYEDDEQAEQECDRLRIEGDCCKYYQTIDMTIIKKGN